MTYGAARGMKDFIMITLGTGVGSGIVVNGQMVYGHDGFAGELGHVIMKRTNGRMCGCGRCGCLEAYCSANGVARTAREFLESAKKILSFAVFLSTKSLLKMCTTAQSKTMPSLKKFSNTPARFLGEGLALILLHILKPRGVHSLRWLDQELAELIHEASEENLMTVDILRQLQGQDQGLSSAK